MLTRSWARLDDVELCRRLTLGGWEHLVAAEARARGALLVTPAGGPWPLVVAAVGLYRGPLNVLVAERSRARRVPGPWLRRFVTVTHAPDTAPGPSREALARRGRVLIAASPAGGEIHFAAELARRAGASLTSMTARAVAGGRWRVDVEPLETSQLR